MPRKKTFGTVKPNLEVAMRRLESKIRALAKEPETYARYHQEIRAFEAQGCASVVPNFEVHR